MTVLMWFRSDLRMHDNTALSAAAKSGDDVIAVFCYTPKQWQAHDLGSNKIAFMHAHVAALRKELAKKNIPLLLPVVADYAASAKKVVALTKKHQCTAVYWNVEYEINERERDKDCAARLEKIGATAHRSVDQTIVHPSKIKTGGGGYYKVFTPFKRAWIQHCQENGLPQQACANVKKQAVQELRADALPQRITGYKINPPALRHWNIGEKAAQNMLERFVQESAAAYKDQRDFPALKGTSALAAHLSIGVISPRQCLRAALQANGDAFSGLDQHGQEGVSTWISELIWREYYRLVIFGFPHVCRGHAFKRATDAIRWSENQEHYQAWCEGRTGIPIVDAGMRQLVQTGWMHNRVRMIVAMFLSKNLFLNWRWGERFFNQCLCDADFASNNGGWQWSASTGTDAAPYFRIFNPYSQSQRFDADGDYIRQFVPELADLEKKYIHEPHKAPAQIKAAINYPEPIVDCKSTRQAAIEAFKEL